MASTLFRVFVLMEDGERRTLELGAPTPAAAASLARKEEGVAHVLKTKVARS